MTPIREIFAAIETFAPLETAEGYDNAGLLVCGQNSEIQTVCVSLDFDEAIAAEAARENAALIIAHHPAMFRPVKTLLFDDAAERAIRLLIKEEIALYAAHTNWDFAQGGLNDRFAEILGFSPDGALTEDGAGRAARLAKPLKLGEIAAEAAKRLNLPNLRFVGDPSREIRTVGIVNGGGADYLETAFKKGLDLFVSGDFKYHQARFAHENQIALLDIPHYNAEISFIGDMAAFLSEKFGGRLNVVKSKANTDVWRNSLELD
jgi:dinuclear metal center YbgI/SA1388 family protein